ncbi:MAG TPA: GntR family transcriptional regulator [Ktedonobacteraceae bacterium]|nr:GntR family transcriptional regulator [Ktedonobacteraceae bacterium]
MKLSKAEEIAEKLRSQILNGTLAEGTRIGPERELANEFGVSRMTARRAIQILEGEGLVASYPVRGTFVGSIRERLLIDKGREVQVESDTATVAGAELRNSGSFLKDMERMGRKPRVQFLEQPALVAANAEIASHLHIEPNSLVLKRYRLQLADNLPYRLIESYYPADLFGELLTTDIGTTPLFAWLQERHGLKVVHAREVLIARLATPNERSLLQISANAPVVAIDRTVWASSGRPVELAHILAVAALYTFTYEYDIHEWSQEREHGKRAEPDHSDHSDHSSDTQ